MNNKVVNKQIPLETIVKVANHLEDYKEKYDRKFEDIPMEYLCPKDPNLSKKNKCPICNYQKQPQGPTLSKKLK